jgi:hypothetical protein
LTAKAFKQRGTREAKGTKLCFAKALCLFAIFCEILIGVFTLFNAESLSPKRKTRSAGSPTKAFALCKSRFRLMKAFA